MIFWRTLMKSDLPHGLAGGFKDEAYQVESQRQHVTDNHGLARIE